MSELTPQMPLFIQNDSGMVIPPRAVVVVTGIEITVPTANNEPVTIHHVTQYSGQAGNILVTGDQATALPGSRVTEPSSGWWSPNKSYGWAYADQRLYVAVDQAVALPQPGDEWGPVSGKWTIGPTGAGFFADGYPTGAGWSVSNVDPSRGIFVRTPPAVQGKIYYGELTSTLTAATNSRSGATSCTVQEYVVPTPGGTATLSGVNITVYDRSLTMNGSSGAFAFWTQIGNELILLGVDCP